MLCLLAVCLLALLTVLFVPIRYRANVTAASKPDTASLALDRLEAYVKISWAANLVRIIAEWRGNHYHRYAKFLWFYLYDSDKPMDDRSNAFARYIMKKRGLYGEESETSGTDGTVDKDRMAEERKLRRNTGVPRPEEKGAVQTGARREPAFSEPKRAETDGGGTKEASETAGETLFAAWKKKISAKYQKLQFLFQGICDKMKKIKKQIEDFTELFGQEFTSRALANLFQKLWRLLCYVLPDKVKGEISFGIEDNPELMGKLLMWLGIFYPVYGRQIAIQPYFDRSFYDVKLGLKGCVRIYRPIYYLLGIVLNRDSIRLIQYLREAGGDKNG